jgi:hypothetical protein
MSLSIISVAFDRSSGSIADGREAIRKELYRISRDYSSLRA